MVGIEFKKMQLIRRYEQREAVNYWYQKNNLGSRVMLIYERAADAALCCITGLE
jgi:hypothetical protein